MNIVKADAAKRFLDKLAGVSDPEQKRKIIGNEFVYVFDDEASKLKDVKFLAQGTLYTRRYRVWYGYSPNYTSHTTTWVVFQRTCSLN